MRNKGLGIDCRTIYCGFLNKNNDRCKGGNVATSYFSIENGEKIKLICTESGQVS